MDNSMLMSHYAASSKKEMGQSVPLSNMPAVTVLPVKQPLNLIEMKCNLGEFLLSVLASEDAALGPDGRPNRVAEDGLDEVIEQLIDEQGARNQGGQAPNESGCDVESSPFVPEHDRVFKAFGAQVNLEYPL